MRYNILGTITCYNKHSSVTKSCRTLCKNIVLLRTELDKCIPNVYSDCMLELRRVRIIEQGCPFSKNIGDAQKKYHHMCTN